MLILVVEDGTIERTLLQALFAESNSVSIVLARSLAEANGLLDDVSFVVLDLSLPDATPEESLVWMRKTGLPTIVYSSIWTNDIIQLAAENGAVSFLTKGTPADFIMASIHFALARENLLYECREERIEACKELAERMRRRLQVTMPPAESGE